MRTRRTRSWWYYNDLRGLPAKKKIISRERGYHGCSIVSGSMTGMSFYHASMDLGTGGLTPPPAGYWPAIQRVLRKHDVLLIADEVITGFGRTGAMFGSDMYGIEPDLITVAKGLTAAYAPLSASIVGERVYEVIEAGAEKVGAFSHGYTYSGHPLGVAAANAVLDIVEREDIPGLAKNTGAHFQALLRKTFSEFSIVGEVRAWA